jgi:hypothetical protein
MMVINLFGDGMYYNVIELSAGELDKIKTISDLSETPIEELLFDLSVLESLGYDSISQFPFMASGGGIRFEKETKFEWKGNRKTLRKFPITELSNDDLLFPAYLINEINLDLAQFNDPTKIRFVLIEIIRGNLGKYILDDNTRLEDVTFEFTTLQNQNKIERLLTNICYQGKKLKNKAKDGVILKQFAVRVG